MLEIDKLHIAFETERGQTSAVQDVSLLLNAGETLAIVGESGSGKSVTALSLLQLLSAKTARYPAGHIWFSPDGAARTDLLKASQQELQQVRGRSIAMIFQEPMTSLNPVFTCGSQVAEALRTHERMDTRTAKQRTIALFERVQLPDPSAIYDRYPHQLSGGQKQRVMIAMATICRPSLLICDEPTTALDVTVQKSILQLIRQLQQEQQMGVIFITHDLGIVAEIADRVAVMYKGQIVEEGAVDTLLQHPQHPYTKGLLACRPALYPKGVRLPVVADFLEAERPQPRPAIIEAPPSHPPQNRLLEVDQLEVLFPGKRNFFGHTNTYTRAVDGVSFEVWEGETLGLVGESGCGKTTLGRALLRLVEPTGGTIRFRGQDIRQYDDRTLRAARKDIQLIFQDPYSALNPSLTVGEAINETLEVHGLLATRRERKDRVVELLEKVNLRAEHYQRYPHEFSGGQRQRIVIARALALEPSFVVCDESVSALDVSVQAQVLNLLNDLKAEFKFTVIFISHDLSVVHYISDRIMVMQKGKIIETGSAEQVYHHPREEYTRQLIASIPRSGF
ncbi:MAG: ABC transporter ATP-binding protein [Bacteroidota bacterium]|nr:ABC transporter ATP-binding protein [Bacteroidota bacterium]